MRGRGFFREQVVSRYVVEIGSHRCTTIFSVFLLARAPESFFLWRIDVRLESNSRGSRPTRALSFVQRSRPDYKATTAPRRARIRGPHFYPTNVSLHRQIVEMLLLNPKILLFVRGADHGNEEFTVSFCTSKFA